MNKLISLFLSQILLLKLCATIPDMESVWQCIHKRDFLQAEVEVQTIWNDNQFPRYKQTYKEGERRQCVEEWIHYTLIKFYIAYLAGNRRDMQVHAHGIQQLAHMEYIDGGR